jgi:hypothetical protein
MTFLGNCPVVKVTYKMVLEQSLNPVWANNTSLHRTPKASAFFASWQIIG